MQTQRNTIITIIVIATIFIIFLIAFIVLIHFLYQRRHLKYQKGLEVLKADFDKTLLSAQLEIQEETFQNISSEIHDNVSLSLTLAKLQLNTINWKDLAKTQEQVNHSIDVISQAMDGLRYISKTLNTDFISEQGLINALEQEINKIKKTERFTIKYIVTGAPVYLETKKELVVFRMIQETLNNSIKHSEAKEICLSLHYSDTGLIVEISDNGKGFIQDRNILNAGTGTGLTNLSKRAKLIDSTCHISSQPGNGTLVQIAIPFINKSS